MTTAIIGWTGFIGQILTSEIQNAFLFNSSNIDQLQDLNFETVYCCGLPAEKWRINKDPESDLINTKNLIKILKTIKVNKFILISTVDVLDCTIKQDEFGEIFSGHPYGIHRKLFEDFVLSNFDNVYILRLPGLFGRGLKKNIIYDLINNKNLSEICLDSEFQWYNIENILKDINYCIKNNIKIIQLVSKPISVLEIVRRFFPESLEKVTGSKKVQYNLTSNYEIVNSEILMEEMGKFIKQELNWKKLPVKLAVSNIAWKHSEIKEIIKILKSFQIENLEIAPTKIADWSEWTDELINELKKYNISFISAQSILFNTNLQIFLERDRFIEHYKSVLTICNKLGIKTVVFGSPKSRHLYETTEDEAVRFFKEVSLLNNEMGINLCIEHNSKLYGCTWLTTLKEVIEFVKKVNNPSFLVNLDLGNFMMENEDFNWSNLDLNIIGHIQISWKNLLPLPFECLDKYKRIIKNLIKLGYKRSISLEMNETTIFDFLNSIIIFKKIILNDINLENDCC